VRICVHQVPPILVVQKAPGHAGKWFILRPAWRGSNTIAL
jgi:hypothetical protein